MDNFLHINWRQDFAFTMPVAEIVFRGTLVYLVIFALLRLILKREVGTLGITDLLVIVLLGDAAQSAMAGEAKSIADGLLLIVTIIFWAYALDWLGYHFPRLQRFLRPPPLQLVQDGRMLRRNMQRELITEDELMSQLRQQGITELAEVKVACMEGDGRISVVARDQKRHEKPERQES